MLMLDTAMCIIDVNNAIREITFTLYPTSSDSLADRYNNVVLPWPVENALYAFMVCLPISDASVQLACLSSA